MRPDTTGIAFQPKRFLSPVGYRRTIGVLQRILFVRSCAPSSFAQHLHRGRDLIDALYRRIQLAAERLHYTIDARVCRLKAFLVFCGRLSRPRRLGAQIFEKLPTRYRPTSTGEEVLELAEDMETTSHKLETRIFGRDQG